MQAHEQRVVDEKTALDEKIDKLNAFINVAPASSATFNSLPREEKDRLSRQLAIMHSYSAVLAERIAAF